MAVHAYKENGRTFYRVHVKDRDNRGKQVNRKKKGISSESAAKRLEVKLKLDLARLKERPVQYGWSSWVEECIDRMKVEFLNSTVIGYQSQQDKWTKPFFGEKDLDQISRKDVHDLLYRHITEVSPETRRTILKQVRRIFNMAIEEGVISKNPCSGIKVSVPEPDLKVLNKSEVERLLFYGRQREHPFFDIWVVALFSGLRSGELYALKWSDVDFDNGYISVNKSWTKKNGLGPTKNRLNRIVPISSRLALHLKEMKLRGVGRDQDLLPKIKEWTDGEQAKILREFCRSIDITEIRFHDLRATFLTQLLLKGVAVAKVMKIAGHAQLKTTMKYLRLVGADVMGATESLDIEIPAAFDAGKVVQLKKR